MAELKKLVGKTVVRVEEHRDWISIHFHPSPDAKWLDRIDIGCAEEFMWVEYFGFGTKEGM